MDFENMKEGIDLDHLDPEPLYDIASCSGCGWRGPVEQCEIE